MVCLKAGIKTGVIWILARKLLTSCGKSDIKIKKSKLKNGPAMAGLIYFVLKWY